MIVTWDLQLKLAVTRSDIGFFINYPEDFIKLQIYNGQIKKIIIAVPNLKVFEIADSRLLVGLLD